MKIWIQALELSMTPDEIKKNIPKDILASIEGKGVIQAYTLAHEGKSQPRVLGEGSQILNWTKAVIRRLSQKIKAGTEFFIDHGQGTNSHTGRNPVGKVLASIVKEINGRMSNVIIGHFPDQNIVDKMDAVSMEAGISVSEYDHSLVDDVTDVTGIALANSDVNSPAFPGALRLSSIQCFDSADENKNLEKEKIKMGDSITFQDVQTFVKEHNVWPHQLFNESHLRGDREFNKVYESNTALELENKKLKDDIEVERKLNIETKKEAQTATAGDRLKELLPKDLTDKQKTYITKGFKPDKLKDLSDDTIKEYIEEGRNDFAEAAKLFGVADSSQSGTGESDGDKNQSDESGAGESSPVDAALKEIGV